MMINKKKRKSRKDNFDLKKEYKQCWDFIKSSRYFIWSVVVVFFMFVLIGYFIPAPSYLSESIMKFLEDLINQTKGMSVGQLISFIFFNNLQSSFIGMVLGVFFGFFSILFALFNGYVLGFVSAIAVNAENGLVLFHLLPHGIFELPAIFLSLGLGIKLGLWLILEPIKFYWNRNKLVSFLFLLFYLPTLLITLYFNKQFRFKMKNSLEIFPVNFSSSLKVFLLVIIPLLIIAAIIEGLLMFFL